MLTSSGTSVLPSNTHVPNSSSLDSLFGSRQPGGGVSGHSTSSSFTLLPGDELAESLNAGVVSRGPAGWSATDLEKEACLVTSRRSFAWAQG